MIIKIPTINYILMNMMTPIIIREEVDQKAPKIKKHSLNKLLKTIKLWWNLRWPLQEKLEEAKGDLKDRKINPNRLNFNIEI